MLKPPPEAVTPLPVEVHPDLSTRERVTLQTEATACATCHALINPLGFTLEHFDAVGRYRDVDRGKPVDATGEYLARSGESVELNGSRELALFLAGSRETSTAFAQQMFQHLVQQSPSAYGPATLDSLTNSFVESGYHIRKLAVAAMVTAARNGQQ
jgi:hypothetical protein